MSWFKKNLNEEINVLIYGLSEAYKLLSEDWIWTDKKIKDLQKLEELDLDIIRKIRKVHKFVRDNPKIYNRILFLAVKLKEDLEILINLRNLSTNVSKEKIKLAKDIINELQILLKKEIEEERLIRGMTRKQAEQLGIEVESFYCVAGQNSMKRIIQGTGVWPREEYRANLGAGLYTFDNLETAVLSRF